MKSAAKKGDLLTEIVKERTAKNPKFGQLVAKAVARRSSRRRSRR